MKFILEINCGNAAFTDLDEAQRFIETARILKKLAKHLEMDLCEDDNLFDINGNKVGRYRFES